MMKKQPAITVIIPFYNRKNLVQEAVESVLDQTFKDYEIILADDGSTDGSMMFLKEKFSYLDTPITFISIPHCGYPGRVRNVCADKASGGYLAFLDSDDLWVPEKLELQLDYMQKNSSLCLSHTREHWLRNGRTVSQKGQKHQREGDVFYDALKKCMIGPSTVMLRKDTYLKYGGFREDLEIAEDYEFWLRLTAEHPVGYIDQPLTIKRAGHGEQLSEKYGQIEVFRLKALMDLIESHNWPPLRQKEAIEEAKRKALIYAAGCRKRGRIEEAEYYERWYQSV